MLVIVSLFGWLVRLVGFVSVSLVRHHGTSEAQYSSCLAEAREAPKVSGFQGLAD